MKITFWAIRFAFHVATGFLGLFALIFIGAIVVALISAVISMIKTRAPVIVVAGVIFLIVALVKKSREEKVCSYIDNY